MASRNGTSFLDDDAVTRNGPAFGTGSFTEFYWVSLAFAGYGAASSGFTDLNQVLLFFGLSRFTKFFLFFLNVHSFTWFSWVLLGLTGFYWV